MPDWLSTHPSPGNRTGRIQDQIAATGVSGTIVNSREYLRQLDGMVFGDNPREGFFQENAFYHPDLRFQLAFPRGFKTQNQKQAVVGVSEAQDAIIALTLAAGTSPEEAARQFFSQQGVQAGRSGRDTIGGLPAYTALFEAATEQGALRGEVSFVSYDGKIYRILGYTPADRFARYQDAFAATLHSFGRLTEPRYLNVQPKRIALVNPGRQMGLPEFDRAYPSTVKIETIGLINGVAASQMFPRGELAKRVVGGRLPE
jgi:predicted Zn-dependent protease